MAAPRIDRLLDHTVRVWRPTVSNANRLGVESRAYEPAAEVAATVNRAVDPVADIGPGMAPVGRRRLYMRPDADVQIRDVIEIVAGPDAPGTWEVDQPPERPRGHHTQVDAVAWNGILPIIPQS